MQNNTKQNHSSRTGLPKFKVVLLGEAGVGKSSIFMRLKDNVFADYLQPTIGIESCSKVVDVDGEKIMVWDTSGAERYRTLTRNYYRNSHALFLVYSLDNPASLHYLSKWLGEALDVSPNATAFLIGNKSDLERSVPIDSVVDFAEAHTLDGAFDVSAKTGDGFNSALRRIGRKITSSFQLTQMTGSLFDDSVNVRRIDTTNSCSCAL